jgi:uncharacterized protein (TIGR03663 family)
MRGGVAAWFGLLVVLGVALGMRLPQLGLRPLHTDEAVHSIKFRGLWEEGVYRYDPHEYHGPVLYYSTVPIARLGGDRPFAELKEATLRVVPALFGVALIPVLWLVRKGQGRWGTLWAGVFTAVSPAMVFYSRYYIHETLLVFFTFLFIAASWCYLRSRKPGWCVVAGAALGLMHATKETFVFAVAAVVGAALLAWIWERRIAGGASPWPRFEWRHLLWGAGTAVVVSVLFYSSFFTNLAGPWDSVKTYLTWFDRAQGASPHVHAWDYYLKILAYQKVGRGPVWSEGLILGLAAIGFVAALVRRRVREGDEAWLRFVGFYSVLLMIIYSVIPYKTPWCLLGFLHGLILLAGLGAATLVGWARRLPWRIAVTLLILGATAQLAVQAHRASYEYVDNRRNPYVYAHTLSSLLNLVEKVEALGQVHPQGRDMVIKVMARGGDYWPLPWYFRRFNRTGWWADMPDDPAAPVVIASPSFEAQLQETLGTTHEAAGYYGLRPGVFLVMFVEKETWRGYLRVDDAEE